MTNVTLSVFFDVHQRVSRDSKDPMWFCRPSCCYEICSQCYSHHVARGRSGPVEVSLVKFQWEMDHFQNISKPTGLCLDRSTNQTHRGIGESCKCPSCKICPNYNCCHGAPCPRWVYAHSQYGFQWMVRQGWWCILDALTGLDMWKKAILSILFHNMQATENEFECFTGTETLHYYSSPLHLVGKCSIATFDQKKVYPCYRMLMTMSTEL